MCYGNCFKLQLGMMSGKQNRYSIIATGIDIQDDFFGIMFFHGGRNLLSLIWAEHPGDGMLEEEADAKPL